jgi:DNA-binding winged helix-turn-helix (wHTH) protein
MLRIDEAFVQVAEAIRAQGAVPEDVIMNLEMLRGSVGRWLSGATGALCAPKHGRWIVSPTGVRLDLARRPTLRRLVMALVEARVTRPGEAVPGAELVAAGWPGETVSPETSANRLRVAICRLRQLGFETVIVTTSSGWMIDPAVPVVRHDSNEATQETSGEAPAEAAPESSGEPETPGRKDSGFFATTTDVPARDEHAA